METSGSNVNEENADRYRQQRLTESLVFLSPNHRLVEDFQRSLLVERRAVLSVFDKHLRVTVDFIEAFDVVRIVESVGDLF